MVRQWWVNRRNEAIFAACYGEIFCLGPITGNVRWHNPLAGFGTGLTMIATESNPGSGIVPALAQQRRRDEEGAAATM
jgi:hypothetical protein